MLSVLQISEGAHGLVLAYPAWIAIALSALAIALLAFTALRGARLRRRWPATLSVLFAAWAAFYVATYRTSVNAESGSAYAFMRFDHTVRWSDAADIYLEHRDGGGWHIVVIDRERRAYPFDVGELSVEQRDHVMAYMIDRMPESAFSRVPELMTRRAPAGARRASFFSDQQI